MHLDISYTYNNSQNQLQHSECFAPSNWTIDETKDWFEKRHNHIHHCGVKVINIKLLDESNSVIKEL